MAIDFFGLSTCIHCKHAREYLDQCGVDYACVYVDKLTGKEREDVIKTIKEHNPSVSFPTMIINGVVVVGFNQDKIDEALGKK